MTLSETSGTRQIDGQHGSISYEPGVRWINSANGHVLIELTEKDFKRLRTLLRASSQRRDLKLLDKLELIVAWCEGKGLAKVRGGIHQ